MENLEFLKQCQARLSLPDDPHPRHPRIKVAVAMRKGQEGQGRMQGS